MPGKTVQRRAALPKILNFRRSNFTIALLEEAIFALGLGGHATTIIVMGCLRSCAQKTGNVMPNNLAISWNVCD